MADMSAHVVTLDTDDAHYLLVHPASQASVDLVLNSDPQSIDGRSPWVWVRLPNGDLVLGVYPQGDTYFAVDADAHYSGELPEMAWCESCGERPIIVRAQNAGLCHVCAAKTIDQLSEEIP